MKIRERFGRPIEPRIFPLVETLNIPGVCETIASCEGHRNWFTGEMLPAYVYFRATLKYAAVLNQQVYDDACLDTPRLNHYWHMRGMFDGENTLAFYLSIPDYDRAIPLTLMDYSCLRLWRRWSRDALDADFETLRAMASTALTQLRQDHEPSVDHQEAGQGDQPCCQPCVSEPLFGAWPHRQCGPGCSALWANIGIPTNRMFAVPAWHKFSQGALPCSSSSFHPKYFATGGFQS